MKLRNFALSTFLLVALLFSCGAPNSEPSVAYSGPTVNTVSTVNNPSAPCGCWECIPPHVLDSLLQAAPKQKEDFRSDIVFKIKPHIFYTDASIIPELEKDFLSSMDILNEAFHGYYHFETDSIIWSSEKEIYIGDLMSSRQLENQICKPYDEDGFINLYIMPTNTDLLGYTLMLANNFQDLSGDDTFSRVFLSYPSLKKGTTLTHEIGHWLSLGHAFQICANYMSYDCRRDFFTTEQLENMVIFGINFREYLMH